MSDTTRIKNELAVLVPSCDKYSDLWRMFFTLFRRFWPDCPLNVYLLSNTVSCDIPGVNTILSGDDGSWSDCMIKAVNRIREKYVLLFLDDLFLRDYVDTKKVSAVLGWIVQNRPSCVKMNCLSDNLPVGQKPENLVNEYLGLIPESSLYRVSTVLTVWQKGVLRDLLRPGESIWDFEISGSVRADAYSDFYSTCENFFPVINTVILGRWRRNALKKLKALSVYPDLGKRPVMTFSQTCALYLKERRSLLFNLFPPQYKRRVKECVLKRSCNYAGTARK